MANTILINPFEVPEGNEEKCIAFWEKAAEYMKRQPGFISTKLHRATSPNAKFYLVNIAEWETEEHFKAALTSEEFQTMIQPYTDLCPHFPGTYEVIRT